MEPGSPEFERYSKLVMIVMVLDPRSFPGLDRDPSMITAMLRRQVSLGLRFKLSYQGITGLSFIEADYVDPQRNPELQVPWIPKNNYISSSPSLFTSFTQALESVFLRLEKIQFEELSEQFINTLSDIQNMVRDAEVAKLRTSILTLGDDFLKTNDHINSLLAETDDPGAGQHPVRTAIQVFGNTLARL
jgi:hypothetical protein